MSANLELVRADVVPTPAGPPIGMFDIPGCAITPTGLVIQPGMPIDDWVELGKRLSKAKDSLGIWRGDWIEYGKHEYGKKYKEALALTGLKEGTLRNDVWIANAFSHAYGFHGYWHFDGMTWIGEAIHEDDPRVFMFPNFNGPSFIFGPDDRWLVDVNGTWQRNTR